MEIPRILAPDTVLTAFEEEKQREELSPVEHEAEKGVELAEDSVGPAGKEEEDLKKEEERLRVEEELEETKKVIEDGTLHRAVA